MKIENKNSLIRLYQQKSKNFNKLDNPKDIQLKKSFLKSKTSLFSNVVNLPELEDKSSENSKILLYEDSERKEQLVLPSILNYSNINKNSQNSSTNNIFQNNNLFTPIKNNHIKLRKIKIKNLVTKDHSPPTTQNKNLIGLYNENLRLKQRLHKYKIKNAENMHNFSYRNYNYNLIKLSSMDLSDESFKSFRNNMKKIEDNFNGLTIQRKNRWSIFLDKIGNIAPEGLKKKILSLSERKSQDKIEN